MTKTYRPKDFLTGRYYDLILAHNSFGGSFLSSGEYQLLNLLSRLYFYQDIYPKKFSNITEPKLFVLDEADIGLHPEWQRLLIYTLVSYFNERASDNASESVQVIITTHSPIILSDIPKQYISFIQRDNNGITTNVTQEQKETFATNIFELYQNSFFLKDGMLGEFSKNKICYIQKSIQEENPNCFPILRKCISTIGDQYVKYALQVQLDKIDRQNAIKILESRIEELKRADTL